MKARLGTLALIIAAIACVAVLMWQDTAQTRARQLEQALKETRPLTLQCSKLERQISTYQRKVVTEQAGTGTVQFLVTDLTPQGWETVLEPLSTYGYPIALGLSLNQYPGAAGCLTRQQAKPFSYCYAYDPDEAAVLADDRVQALALWLGKMEETATQWGFTMQPVLYFPEGAYLPDAAPVLQAAGIEVVIHHGEVGTGLMNPKQMDGIWYVGSAWWRGNEILASKLQQIGTTGGELVTVMGVDRAAQNRLEDWMADFESKIQNLDLTVTDFDGMALIQTDNVKLGAEARAEAQQQIVQLETQLKDLRQQIDEINRRYEIQEGA